MKHALIVLLFCLLVACGAEDPGSSRSDDRSGERPTAGRGPGGGPGGFSRGPTFVVAEPASVRTIRDEVEAIGTTLANESVTLTAKVTDTVSKVRFEDGELVKSGQVLVEITNTEQAALLAESEANVQDAHNQFQRFEKLAADGSVPVSQLDESSARLAAVEARYQSLLARLEDRLIRAPFSGLLGFRQVSEGTLVSPGTPIATLDDISLIKLDFSIPEVHLALVRPGLKLSAESSAYAGTTFHATVNTIGSRIDPVTRAATVRAHIANDDLLLRPGMLMTVRLIASEREALMVPEISLVQRASQVFVFTIRDERAEMLQVSTGARDRGWIEILGGLDAGQAVITEGVIKIRDGAPVTIVPLDRAPRGRPPGDQPAGD